MDWTSEQITQLTRMWEDGLSTAEIGKRLGISKNAVVGKAHRLHLAARPSPIKRIGPRPASVPRAIAHHPRPAPQFRPAPPQAAPAPRVVVLSNQTCMWPIGHPGETGFHFCTERAIQGKPYCVEHAAMAYVKPKPKGEAA
jgi:GcrA cell cycle regulator